MWQPCELPVTVTCYFAGSTVGAGGPSRSLSGDLVVQESPSLSRAAATNSRSSVVTWVVPPVLPSFLYVPQPAGQHTALTRRAWATSSGSSRPVRPRARPPTDTPPPAPPPLHRSDPLPLLYILQSINQSIRNCLSSRATSRLIVKLNKFWCR